MKKVFVSSPYTIGDTALNVKTQIDAGNELINLGFAPFLPLLSHFQHMAHPQPYEKWLQLDMQWLYVCDCVLRLPGESSGADKEVEMAELLDIPVYYSIEELVKTEAK